MLPWKQGWGGCSRTAGLLGADELSSVITLWATRTRSCGFAVKANILNALEHPGQTASTENSKDRVSWGVWDKIYRCFSCNSTRLDTGGLFYFLNHYKNGTTDQKTRSGGHSHARQNWLIQSCIINDQRSVTQIHKRTHSEPQSSHSSQTSKQKSEWR